MDITNSPGNDIIQADILAGHNIVSMRAVYDEVNCKIVASGERQLFQFSVNTGLMNQTSSANLDPGEVIVSCNQINRELFLFSNAGKVLVWDMDALDWIDEFSLRRPKGEELEAGLAINNRQFCYALKKKTNSKLHFSQRPHARAAPECSQVIGSLKFGSLNYFDVGSGIIAFCDQNAIYLGLYEEFDRKRESLMQKTHLIKDLEFSCIRCNKSVQMVAAGDSLGRIHLYIDQVLHRSFVKKTTLHWHSLPVNDLCFSSTGNLLYSVGSESGCVVIWNLNPDYMGEKQVIARLGMPIRFLNCALRSNQLVLSFEDNELQFIATDNTAKRMKTFTTQASNIYKTKPDLNSSVGLLYHSKSNCLVSNGKLGQLQFFSPKTRSTQHSLNILNTDLLSLSREGKVLPSDITSAAFSLDGEWLAAYETRYVKNMFPDIKLHIWRKKDEWEWIQTIDRLHETTNIVCLKFSTNNRYLLSVDDQGHMNLLHKIKLDGGSNQMFARGYFGAFGSGGHIKCAFSNDSSVISASIKDECPYLWTIANPYKVVFTTQFNFEGSKDQKKQETNIEKAVTKSQVRPNPSVEIYFGLNEHTSTIVDIRKNHVRVWDVICPEKACRYTINNLHQKSKKKVSDTFIAAAFDHHGATNHFAICTKKNLFLVFSLDHYKSENSLQPLIILNANLNWAPKQSEYTYTDLIFINKNVNDCKVANSERRIINRVCLMTSTGKIVAFNDKLEIEKKSFINSCNSIPSCNSDDLKAYFSAMGTKYVEEQKKLLKENKLEDISLSKRQKMIKSKLEIKKLLKDVILRVPSHALPAMDTLGPMILDRLIHNEL